MRFLRQNTAVIITVGPFYAIDGLTIAGSLTITNERITLTADTDAGSAPTNILDNVTGATAGTNNDLNYITGNDAGMMQLELAAADTNRVGRMFLSITDAANHVPVFHEFFALPQAIYDWLTGVVTPLPVNVTAMAAGVVTAAAVATGAVDADALATDGVDKIADGFLNRNMATGTDSGTDSTAVRTPRQALRALRNKAVIAAGVLTVNKEDDSTPSWTAAITRTAGDPISTLDPT